MHENDAFSGPEEEEIISERLSVPDHPGIFNALRTWGRGAFGKVLLATALTAGAAKVNAEEGPDGSVCIAKAAETTSDQQTLEAPVQKEIAHPFAVAEDGSVVGVKLNSGVYKVQNGLPDMDRPRAGVYHDAEADIYYYVSPKKEMVELELSPDRVQPPEGGTWVTYISEETGKVIERPQSRAEILMARNPGKLSRRSSVTAEVKPAIPEEEEVKPDTFRPVDASVAEAEEAVRKLGFLTIEHGYDMANQREALLRGRSIVQPTGYIPVRLTIITHMGNTGKGKAFLPCPRDVGDQLHVVSSVNVYEKGRKVQVDSKIVYSQDATTGGGKGYENPFVSIHAWGRESVGRLGIQVDHIVLLPVYPPVDKEQLVLSMGPAAAVINFAAQKAAAVPWDGSINGINSNLFRQFGKGDCGVKAAVAQDAGRGLVAAAEGYSLKPTDEKFGGRHCINFAQSPNGSLIFDPRSAEDLYVGPQKDFIITEIGGSFKIKEFKDEVLHASNGGIYSSVRDYGMASVTGKQTIGAGTAPEIAQYANALWNARMKQYQEGDIAFNR